MPLIVQSARAWYLTQLAAIAQLFKQRDAAIAYYDKILVQQPRHSLTLSRVAFLHHEAGDRVRAIADFERVVAINPKDANSWFNLGFLRQEAGDHVAAIVAFERTTSLNETHDRAWYGNALSLIALDQHSDAILPLKKNVTLQPMSPYGHMALARVYFKLGELERCEKRMLRLKAFDPKSAVVLEDETGIRVGIDRWWTH